MKKIKIAIKNKEKLEFYLNEDAGKGDYFSLSDLENIDFSDIKNEIKLNKDKYIEEYYKKNEDNFKLNWEKEYKKTPDFIKKERILEELKEELNIAKNENANTEIKINNSVLKKEKEITNLYKEKNDLLIKEIIKEKDQIINKWINQNQFLQSNFNKLDKEKIELEANFKNKILEERNKLNENWEKESKKLQNENITLKELLYKSKIQSSKLIGENLENHIFNSVNNAFMDNENVKIEKTNIVKNGTKPDFCFQIFNRNNKNSIFKIIIEAKSENNTSVDKRKNRTFFDRLYKNKNEHNGDIALLVSELERNKDFMVCNISSETYIENNDFAKNISKYKNMYLLRPWFLISFLKIITIFVNKQQEFENQFSDQINFKQKKEILNEFENIKNKIILTFFTKTMGKQINEIYNQSQKIQNSNERILEIADLLIEKQKRTIEKITNFKIDKMIKKLNII